MAEDKPVSSGTDRYFVDKDSRMVHVKDHSGRSYEADNLDTSTHLVEVASPEQISQILGDKPGKACKRCFPNPTAEQRKKAFTGAPFSAPHAAVGKVDPEGPSMDQVEYDAIEALGPPAMTPEDEEAQRIAGHD
jgi:hypothetical protein